MLYFVAVVLPPLAVLLCGKPIQALLNIFLTLMAYFPGAAHAVFVVHNHYEDQRTQRVIDAMHRQR